MAVKSHLPLTITPDSTKVEIRQLIWSHLEKTNLADFPRPVYGRIPNFKGSQEACRRAYETLPELSSARVVKVAPDTPLKGARFTALQRGQQLLVPTPRLRHGLFNRVTPPSSDVAMLKQCSTLQGLRDHSRPVGLDDKVKIDVAILGSVAVSESGYRIGKGEGFADLEAAMMKVMDAIDDSTPMISIVHYCQVVDIPDKIMTSHDVMLDYIITPTRTIKCSGRTGIKSVPCINWSILTALRLREMPILVELRRRQAEEGIDVSLAPATSARDCDY